jgi:phosphonatase-like hydrolase
MYAIQLVVFDMAGTTVNDEDGVNRCIRGALQAVGLAAAAPDVNRVMGLPKPEAIALLIEQYGRTADLGPRVEEIHRDFVRRSTDFYASDPSVHEVPGASEVFGRLRSGGIRIALNTGFNRAITDVILGRLGWRGRIDASIASDEVERGRPHPDMIRELMRRFDVSSSSRVAKVGDTPADLQEGHNAGCGLIVGVTRGTHTRAELEPFPHTHLIEDIRRFPGLLGIPTADLHA